MIHVHGPHPIDLYPLLCLAWTLLAVVVAAGMVAELIRPSALLLGLLLALQVFTLIAGWPHA